MCPEVLTMDLSISSESIRVFLLLALQNYQNGKKTNLVTISTRKLAELRGTSHETIRKHLKELSGRGHIEILGKARGKAAFRLTAPMFQSNFRVQTAPTVAVDIEAAQLPTVRDKKQKCPKCRKVERITSTSGVCERCLAKWIARTA